ncbi:MAG: extracellular solute-binding protein [Aggregatilineales bacterium]
MNTETIVQLLLIATLKTTLILAMTWIGLRLLKRASASVRHWTCSVALVSAMLIPAFGVFAPTWSIPILPEMNNPVANSSNVTPVPSFSTADNQPFASPHGATDQYPGNGDGIVPPLHSSSASVSNTVTSPNVVPLSTVFTPFINAPAVALIIWLIGVLITLLRGYFQTRHVRHITRRSLLSTDPKWLAEYHNLADQMGVKQPVTLAFSDEVAVPLTWGALHPVIVLPTGAMEWLPERRRIVLLHELAHIARWDYLTQWVALASCAINWFNPLAWHLRHRLALEREQACDDQVLAMGVKSSDYASNLLEIARSVSCWRAVLPIMLTVTPTSNLGNRIRHILDVGQSRHRFTRRRVLSLLLMLTIMLLPFSAARFSTVSAQNSPVTISLAVPSSGIDEFKNTVVKDFEAANPGVTVQVVESQSIGGAAGGQLSDYFDTLQKYASSADVLFINSEDEALTPMATRAGYILNLSPLINSDPSFPTDDFYPQVWSSFQWDNSVWAIPLGAQMALLTYNQARFDSAGLSYPNGQWDLNQFADAVTKLSVKDSSGHLVSAGFANSGRIFREALWRSLSGVGLLDTSSLPNVPRFNVPQVKDVVDAYHQLEAQGLIGGDTNSAAMYGDFASKGPQPGWGWSLFPGGKAVLWPDGFAISAGTQHPDLAYALLKFMSARPDLSGLLSFPARKSLTPVGGPASQFPAAVQPVVAQGFANSLTYSDLLFTDYLNSITTDIASDGVAIVETQAINDLKAASDKKGTLALTVNEPSVQPLPAGKVALNFNIVTSIQPFPTKSLWDNFVQTFTASDPQVGAIHLQVVQEPASMASASADCFYTDQNAVPTLPANAVLDLAPLMSADPSFNAADFPPSVLASVQRDNKTYAMPTDLSPLILRYSQDLFTIAKLPAPSTWTVEDFANALQALKPGSAGYPPFVDSTSGGGYLLVLIADYGGVPIDYRTSPATVNFTDPATEAAIRQVLDLARNGEIKYTALGTTLFGGTASAADKTTALYTSRLDGFTGKKGPPSTSLDAAVFFPTGHQHTGLAYQLGAAYVSAGTQYPEACYRFISALAQHPELFPTMPVRHSLLASPALAAVTGPNVLALYNRIDGLLRDPNTIPFPIFDPGSITISDVMVEHWLFEAFDAYALNGNDLDSALNSAETYAKAYLTCTANLPAASLSSNKGGGDSLKPYVDCAERADPRLKSALDPLINH